MVLTTLLIQKLDLTGNVQPTFPLQRNTVKRRIVPKAAALSTLLVESKPDAALTNGSKITRSQAFLSRQECLEVLNRIVDSCQATSVGSSQAAYFQQREADDEALLVSGILDTLYDEAESVFMSKRGYLIPKREAARVEATGGSPTYGEITGQGIVQFLRTVPLQSDDVLVDLGSGLGRLPLQVASTARLRCCVGMELSDSRHEQAVWVASHLGQLAGVGLGAGPAGDVPAGSSGDWSSGDEPSRVFALRPSPPAASYTTLATPHQEQQQQQHHHHQQQHQEQQEAVGVAMATAHDEGEQAGEGEGEGQGLLLSPLELRREDLMTAELGDGSAFFLCSTAFPAAACRAIAERLSRHPRFRLLVTSRALPFPAPLTLLGQFPCDFSWTARGVAYVYVRNLREAPAGLLAAFLSETRDLGSTIGGSGDQGPGGVTRGDDGDDDGEGEGVGEGRDRGGVAWLPSTCTVPMVPGDLMV